MNVDFMPINPYYLASSCSNRLTIYDTVISEPMATFSRFKSNVTCISYRPDGGLLGINLIFIFLDGYIKYFD